MKENLKKQASIQTGVDRAEKARDIERNTKSSVNIKSTGEAISSMIEKQATALIAKEAINKFEKAKTAPLAITNFPNNPELYQNIPANKLNLTIPKNIAKTLNNGEEMKTLVDLKLKKFAKENPQVIKTIQSYKKPAPLMIKDAPQDYKDKAVIKIQAAARGMLAKAKAVKKQEIRVENHDNVVAERIYNEAFSAETRFADVNPMPEKIQL
jgi:hypothetical protein